LTIEQQYQYTQHTNLPGADTPAFVIGSLSSASVCLVSLPESCSLLAGVGTGSEGSYGVVLAYREEDKQV
jgi:hypothetical protein